MSTVRRPAPTAATDLPAPVPAVDLRRRLQALYDPPREPVLVDVPELTCLMIDGPGAPRGEEYEAALAALLALSDGLHFALQRSGVVDAPVMPLETLRDPSGREGWTALVVQPDEVDQKALAAVLPAAVLRAPAAKVARLTRFAEGRCAQVLHVGPGEAAGATIERLHAFLAEQGLRPRGRHHEIHLGDPRGAPSERLRTLLRRPVA
jgi:hypothetical protein